MTIQLHLKRRQLQLSATEQSLAKAAASRHAMRTQFHTQLSAHELCYAPLPSLHIHTVTLQRMVTKYSEQLIYRPLTELHHWFGYASGRFLQVGYPPLFYNRAAHRLVTPNKSAVAGIGEGVAGLLMQRLYRSRLLARPHHDYPDLVMWGDRSIYLVEAKATVCSPESINQILDDEVLRLSAYVSACAELDSYPVKGVLIGTSIQHETEYDCLITEIDV